MKNLILVAALVGFAPIASAQAHASFEFDFWAWVESFFSGGSSVTATAIAMPACAEVPTPKANIDIAIPLCPR